MKRMLWTTLLVGLALTLSASRVATAKGDERIVVRPIFASDMNGEYVGPAVGMVTFNTETGDWTVSTRDRLPYTDVNLYYPAISVGPPSHWPGYGRYVEDAFFWTYFYAVNGVINESGTVEPWQLEIINQAFEDGGIFLLMTNSI